MTAPARSAYNPNGPNGPTRRFHPRMHRFRRLLMASLAVLAPISGITAVAFIAPTAAHATTTCVNDTSWYDNYYDNATFVTNGAGWVADGGTTTSQNLNTSSEWNFCQDSTTGRYSIQNVSSGKYIANGTNNDELVDTSSTQSFNFAIGCVGNSYSARIYGWDAGDSSYDNPIGSEDRGNGSFGPYQGPYQDVNVVTGAGVNLGPSLWTIGGICNAVSQGAASDLRDLITCPNTSETIGDPNTVGDFVTVNGSNNLVVTATGTDFYFCADNTTGLFLLEAPSGDFATVNTSNNSYLQATSATADQDFMLTCTGSSHQFWLWSPAATPSGGYGGNKAFVDDNGLTPPDVEAQQTDPYAGLYTEDSGITC